ncbi:JAB domain-containing protein [Giesbergeria anulus]|uniref:DNA repair protein RadC n=1 Tax=Giesbergeria anulus TaxID=180197 RepID=A0A1H9NH89_9BURK|nr:JAB domain-containing protein [Giesbergeria anulus]SER35147.1 DNA repair protein RadC [Giesbergeria anulus]
MTDDEIIEKALTILDGRIRRDTVMSSPDAVKKYLTIQAAKHDGREVFGVMFIDKEYRVIDFQYLFFGTIAGVSIYIREIVRAALQKNAEAVIITHNHPNGNTIPSSEDIATTKKMKEALSLVDVMLLDHVITSGRSCLSMTQEGII